VARGLTIRLVACDWQTPLAEIDTFESATVIQRFNELSTWELVMPSTTPAAAVLLNSPMPRVLVINAADGSVLQSGPVVRFETSSDVDGDVVHLYGTDDMVWLRRRIVHPEPGTVAPPYNHQAYDVATGAASTVLAGYVSRNAGPAALPARQVPGLTVPTPAPFGPTITLSGRYQNLLEFVQQAAGSAGLGVRVRNLTFETFVPSGGAIFSVDLGTLASWRSTRDAPDVNYVYVGGGGDGTARVVREYQSVPSVQDWGRFETFQDRRDTTATADMDQAAAETLADGVHPTMVEMDALDTISQRFLRDWSVGDLATVRIGTTSIRDVISQATITMEPNRPAVVTPLLGDGSVTLAQWRALDIANRRIRQLERN